MGAFESISEMMQHHAEEAVRQAGERFGFTLDFSCDSIESLETILSSVSAGIDTSNEEAVEAEVKQWGGYFGEAVRRNFGGAWDLIQYPGKAVAVPTLVIGESQLYPLMKVHRRLTLGDSENVWKYYEAIQGKLSAARPN
jgi:hypothetical protein